MPAFHTPWLLVLLTQTPCWAGRYEGLSAIKAEISQKYGTRGRSWRLDSDVRWLIKIALASGPSRLRDFADVYGKEDVKSTLWSQIAFIRSFCYSSLEPISYNFSVLKIYQRHNSLSMINSVCVCVFICTKQIFRYTEKIVYISFIFQMSSYLNIAHFHYWRLICCDLLFYGSIFCTF